MYAITTVLGAILVISGPVAIGAYLLGRWAERRDARWEQHLDKTWDAASAPQDVTLPEPGGYPGAADDDDEWLAGIKSRTDAFIALHCTEPVLFNRRSSCPQGLPRPNLRVRQGTRR